MTRRLLGLAFVAILLAGVSLSILSYNKAFTPVVWVTLRTDSIGLQLNDGAEVKLRDVVVGEVREIDTSGRGASLRLALDPDLIAFIPQNVHARLLPRTVFGERFVALVPPPDAAPQPIRAGAVITQDRSANAIELEQVLDHSLALLQKIKVDKLAATLNALATALEGRGERIGKDIVTMNAYLEALNREMPGIRDDVRLLADVLSAYDGAAADLLAFLRDVTVTASTVTQQRTELQQFLVDATGAANETEAFLDRHGGRIIAVGDVTAPVASLLAAYAPTYPCVMAGIVGLQARTSRIFDNGRMHVTQYNFLDTPPAYEHQGKYVPGDELEYLDTRPANCRTVPGLVNLPPNREPARWAPAPDVRDGYRDGGPGAALFDPSIGLAGSPAERGLIRAIVAAHTGTSADQVPDSAVLLWGPLLRGTQVSFT